nr:unnamed protein product [Callosobruchus chinensis]
MTLTRVRRPMENFIIFMPSQEDILKNLSIIQGCQLLLLTYCF